MSMARPPEPSGLAVLPGAAAILAAGDVAACHAAIVHAVDGMDRHFGCAVRVCEVSLSPAGEAVMVWQSGDPSAIPLDENGAFGAWFRKARRLPGALHDLHGNVAGLLAAGAEEFVSPYFAIFADAMPGSIDGLPQAMQEIALVAAGQLRRLRQDMEYRLNRARLDGMSGLQADLLRVNVDLLWQADEAGMIQVTQVFNGRQDLVRRLAGKPLSDVRVAGGRSLADVIARGGPARGLRLDHPGEDALYISVGAGRAVHGTLAAGGDLAAERLAADVHILETMVGARHREEEARREAEGTLLGLRVLLAALPFREKLERLAGELARAADCDMVQVIQLRPGEAPRLLSPPALLSSHAAEALRRVLVASEGRSVTVLAAAGEESAVIRTTLGAESGDIALVTLPYAADRFHLVCRARPIFDSRKRGVAERFSLLLQQALALRDDQDRMVHTAKLSALGQLSTSIAHELRQPLNTISIAAQNVAMLVERQAVTPELLTQKVERILQQVDRACRVMERMRRFGRKSSGDYRPLPLLEVVRSARSLMQAVAEQARVDVDIEIAGDLMILADELELEQVLVNLLQNACDAIADQAGKGLRRIWIRGGPDPADPELVRLEVEDSGPGFAANVLGHALDAFFTTKAEGKGTGLGLSISHAILREHGGRLQVGNAAGGGGLITLFLRSPAARDKVVAIGRPALRETS